MLGLLALASACDDDRISARPASGFFSPEVVDFGDVAVGRTTRSITTFRNTSGSELFVRAVRFEPERDVFAAFLEDGGTLNGALLPAGQAIGVELRFGPREEGRFDAAMVVITEDLAIELPVLGAARLSRPATPSVEPTAIGFSGVAPGSVAVREIEVRNAGDQAGVLSSATVTGPPFEIGVVPGSSVRLPVELEVGASVVLEVRYRPSAPDTTDAGRARLGFDSGEVVEVGLTGRSTAGAALVCPSRPVDFGAVPRGRTASRSAICRSDGPQWRFESASLAPGSAPYFRVVGDPRVEGESFALDLAFDATGPVGRHIGILEVRGAGGELSRLTVTGTIAPPAPGEADLLLTLAWNTPHSDFDLHLVRAGGAPFVAGEDCYFASKNPDWGERGRTLDDPFLDRDDREGYGPESIALVEAREASYDVFVQYHDYLRGVVEATTVEVDWRLRTGASGTARRDLLECADWWHVGRVRTEPLRFEPIDVLTKDHQARAAERCR